LRVGRAPLIEQELLMPNTQAAVIGSGFIGPVHVEALRRAGVSVVGVLDVDFERSRQAAAALRLEKAYRDLDHLLADADVHSVHIATPNRCHYEMAVKTLQAGKHVMCEKPLAMNSRESGELVERACRANVAAGVNYNIRYYPLCLEAAQQVRDGAVGRLFHVAGSYVQDWLFHDTDFNWRVLADEGGALRAVADIGTHWLDLIQSIAGEHVTAVCADLSTVYPVRHRPSGQVETFSGQGRVPTATEACDVDTEDYGCVMLRFSGGGRGCLWVSQVTAGRKNCLRFELAGSKKSLAWNSELPNELWMGQRDRANECLIRDPALMTARAAALTAYPGGHNEGFPDTFKHCFQDFYRYIEAGDLSSPPPFPTFADGHREILLCEAILSSHREQRWIEMASHG
jgi:predicted dehydrogenase